MPLEMVRLHSQPLAFEVAKKKLNFRHRTNDRQILDISKVLIKAKYFISIFNFSTRNTHKTVLILSPYKCPKLSSSV